jgi:hypothetical protein
MSSIKQHITQLKEVFRHIEEYLDKFDDESLLAEKESQLNNIEKSIRNLQKGNIPIPQELRDLKLRLVDEIERLEVSQKSKTEVVQIIDDFLQKHKPVKRKIKKRKKVISSGKKASNKNITIKDLLDNGIITNDCKLYRKYKGEIFYADILPDGHIATEVNGKIQIFNSPSTAAGKLTVGNQNGWTWWLTDFNGETQSLDYYRQKYLQKQTNSNGQ